jgi:dTDP-glucose 4,6-dehydratase
MPIHAKVGHMFLTGGTGFFGRSLLRHLVEQFKKTTLGPNVTILTRSPDAFLSLHPEFLGHPWLHFHAGNLLDPKTYPSDQAFTHLLHAAADSTLGPTLSPLERYTQIVEGTGYLLDYAVKQQIGRFLLVSSGGVYGPQPVSLEKIPESFNGMADPLIAANAYSVGKRVAEHLCALYQDQHGIETVIARCFAFVGADLPLDVHFAIGNFIRDALINQDILVKGDGTPLRTYMDQRDLAEWLLSLLANGRSGEAYNVGSDEPISISALAHLVRDLVSPGKTVCIQSKAMGSIERNRYVPSIKKAKLELGLSLHYTLDQGIISTAQAAKRMMNR